MNFIAQCSPTVTQLADVKCAVSEAVTNCIVHAYPLGKFTNPFVEMILRHFDDNSVTIVIRDRGIGIADIKAARDLQNRPFEVLFGDGGADLRSAII